MTRLIDADELKAQIPTIEDEYKYVHKLIDNTPTVLQVTVFAENADEQAVADLKAELQSVIEARPQGRPIFNREELEQALNYWYEHLEVGNEEQNKAVWCAINTIKYCIEHNSDYQEGGAE